MRFHHMALFVADLEEAIHLWRDVLGFDLNVQMQIPDGDAPGPTVFVDAKTLDDSVGVWGAKSKMALMSSREGSLIELQQFQVPAIEKTPPERLRHRHTGIRELGLSVEGIDGWFEKIRAAGYETQTEYVWSSSTLGRSFLFYDREGNMIQLWEPAGARGWDDGAEKRIDTA